MGTCERASATVMKRASGPARKGISLHTHSWRYVLAAGLVVSLLAAFFAFNAAPSAPVFASAHLPASPTLTSSPTQGPVGAVIAVTGSNVNQSYPNGTQVQLGYTTDFFTCNAVADSQPGVIQNHSFSGWFRWPASTGTGSFGVCASIRGSDRPSIAGNYQVLSATPAQVSVAPTTLDAGKQATVTGANFLPAGTSVNLVWQTANGGQSLSLGTVSSDANGAFSQTFSVPSRASTGSYTVVATSGGGQPPTLSATTTFHVNGITIVAMPTPTAQPDPTAAPSPSPTVSATATKTSGALGTSQSTNANGNNGSTTSKASLLLPIGLIGLLLIVVALVVGVLVVRRQRALALVAASADLATGMSASPMFAPGAVYQANALPPPGNPGMGRSSMPAKMEASGQGRAAIIPFDPGLAEAMRQAQVSLFATPRPPVGEEVPS